VMNDVEADESSETEREEDSYGVSVEAKAGMCESLGVAGDTRCHFVPVVLPEAVIEGGGL